MNNSAGQTENCNTDTLNSPDYVSPDAIPLKTRDGLNLERLADAEPEGVSPDSIKSKVENIDVLVSSGEASLKRQGHTKAT